MSHRAGFGYIAETGGHYYIRTKPHKDATGPQPLHITFDYSGNSKVNREMIRRSRRRTTKNKRRSTRSVKANKIKCQVKTISLRQHRNHTIVWFMGRK